MTFTTSAEAICLGTLSLFFGLFEGGTLAVFYIKLGEVPDVLRPAKHVGVEGFVVHLLDGELYAVIIACSGGEYGVVVLHSQSAVSIAAKTARSSRINESAVNRILKGYDTVGVSG